MTDPDAILHVLVWAAWLGMGQPVLYADSCNGVQAEPAPCRPANRKPRRGQAEAEEVCRRAATAEGTGRMIDVDESTRPATVEELADRIAAIGLDAQPRGRPRRFVPAELPTQGGCRSPVYGKHGRWTRRWGTHKECAESLGVHHATVAKWLDHPEVKVNGWRLTREAPPVSKEEELAELRRLAYTFVRVPPGGTVGPRVLAARRAVGMAEEATR